jgi:hypothetical protein
MELCWVAGGGLRVAPGVIRRDVMTILTHHAASRQAAMAPYGHCCSPTLGDPRHDQG